MFLFAVFCKIGALERNALMNQPIILLKTLERKNMQENVSKDCRYLVEF